ncbi:chlorite dismutase [Pseudoclavibacter sp. RFBJ3]|uniref:hydrogen peroxide-dependent heme synthase n=1 Tax=unclassified Pseudoclavibacter TaxID=2615177 RepID=UPI000CE79F0B|nr:MULTISPECIES: hydrogen peroxide-dependent heme synthase [unclassified Pseudoclavibacter]PPF87498.1 chlorite dismutase [Pseudoclavibacter sp. RFBJ5]PPF90348.1 chlorite dismutase [Pseudoclavibacter sp. RFBJ3]PPG01033.1 chlorite dismutase [Pseudoclavibacter sp. RFBH5]PPG26136.1 chlorite dismutase [Pseudoclavibacter sp. RFBI4]
MENNEADTRHYTLWNVFGASPTPSPLRPASTDELSTLIDTLASRGVTVRGLYDVSGLRAGADVMVWMHGDDPAELQAAARAFRRQTAFAGMIPTWNALGVHRDAEFTRSHVPAFARGVAPAQRLTLYPFNRSYEWYLLPEEERRELLAEHGRAGSAYRDILTNTVSAFALGDFEWLLPLEADDPVDLVDLMRTLRATRARLHVRDEIPFFTGRRVEPREVLEILGA